MPDVTFYRHTVTTEIVMTARLDYDEIPEPVRMAMLDSPGGGVIRRDLLTAATNDAIDEFLLDGTHDWKSVEVISEEETQLDFEIE